MNTTTPPSNLIDLATNLLKTSNTNMSKLKNIVYLNKQKNKLNKQSNNLNTNVFTNKERVYLAINNIQDRNDRIYFLKMFTYILCAIIGLFMLYNILI